VPDPALRDVQVVVIRMQSRPVVARISKASFTKTANNPAAESSQLERFRVLHTSRTAFLRSSKTGETSTCFTANIILKKGRDRT